MKKNQKQQKLSRHRGEMEGGGWFPGQRVKELKEHVGITVKDSSLMGMFEAVTGCAWVAAVGQRW